MAVLLSFEIVPKWVASSSTAGSYFGFAISTQQPISLCFSAHSQQGGEERL